MQRTGKDADDSPRKAEWAQACAMIEVGPVRLIRDDPVYEVLSEQLRGGDGSRFRLPGCARASGRVLAI